MGPWVWKFDIQVLLAYIYFVVAAVFWEPSRSLEESVLINKTNAWKSALITAKQTDNFEGESEEQQAPL